MSHHMSHPEPEPEFKENDWCVILLTPPFNISTDRSAHLQLSKFFISTPDGKKHQLNKNNEYRPPNKGSVLGAPGLYLLPLDERFLGQCKNQGTETVTKIPLASYLPEKMSETLRHLWKPLWERFKGMIRKCSNGHRTGSFGADKYEFQMEDPIIKQKFVGEEEKVTLPDGGVKHGLPVRRKSDAYYDDMYWAYVAPAEEGKYFSDDEKRTCETCIEEFAKSDDLEIRKLGNFLSFFRHGGFKYMVRRIIKSGYFTTEALAHCSIGIAPPLESPEQLPIELPVSVELPCSILPPSETSPVTIEGISSKGDMFKHFGIASPQRQMIYVFYKQSPINDSYIIKWCFIAPHGGFVYRGDDESMGCYLCIFGVSEDNYKQMCTTYEVIPEVCHICMDATATHGYRFEQCVKHPTFCERCSETRNVKGLKKCPMCRCDVKESDLVRLA